MVDSAVEACLSCPLRTLDSHGHCDINGCMGKVLLASAPRTKFGRPELISYQSVASGCVRPGRGHRGCDH